MLLQHKWTRQLIRSKNCLKGCSKPSDVRVADSWMMTARNELCSDITKLQPDLLALRG